MKRTIRKQVHCSICDLTWLEVLGRGVPVSVWIAQIKALRCSRCLRGYGALSIMTVDEPVAS
jgi:hypothetical protein